MILYSPCFLLIIFPGCAETKISWWPSPIDWRSYNSVSGKLIAFEYEIAQKPKKRYQDKIRKYVNCIRQNNFESSPKFDHVHIVCEKVYVYKMLLNFTAIYKNYFTIEMSSDFLKRFQNDEVNLTSQSSAGNP